MDSDEIAEKSQRLMTLLEKHLGARGKTLESAVRRAGRRLPKGLRAQAVVLVDAQKMSAHPKLQRRIDGDAFAAAYAALEAHLVQIDLAEQRKTRTLNIAAGVALNLLILGVAVLVILRWRGLI